MAAHGGLMHACACDGGGLDQRPGRNVRRGLRRAGQRRQSLRGRAPSGARGRWREHDGRRVGPGRALGHEPFTKLAWTWWRRGRLCECGRRAGARGRPGGFAHGHPSGGPSETLRGGPDRRGNGPQRTAAAVPDVWRWAVPAWSVRDIAARGVWRRAVPVLCVAAAAAVRRCTAGGRPTACRFTAGGGRRDRGCRPGGGDSRSARARAAAPRKPETTCQHVRRGPYVTGARTVPRHGDLPPAAHPAYVGVRKRCRGQNRRPRQQRRTRG